MSALEKELLWAETIREGEASSVVAPTQMITDPAHQPVYSSERATVFCGDCLDVMRLIPDSSVDACITDPPYGTTACSWDAVIPFAPMWQELKRVTKNDGAIVLFGSQPFTSALIMSNPQMFKYQWVWEKTRPSDFVNAPNKPLKAHEDISVFSQGTTANGSSVRMVYNPQGLTEVNKRWRRPQRYNSEHRLDRPSHSLDRVIQFENYPRSVLLYENSNHGSLHSTQKPVDLLRYLVRTYTNEGETVLDFTCGSGTTGEASMIEGRRFIGIEKDSHDAATTVARVKRACGIAADIPKRGTQAGELPLFGEGVN